MPYLLDTGILLRLINKQDALHNDVNVAVEALATREESLLTTVQNFAEFYNVATGPVANNGFGQPPATAIHTFQHEIEPICTILVEKDTVYSELKRLIQTYYISGKQVHDARQVAMMLVWQVTNILTLNDQDFRRYQRKGLRS